MATKKQQRRKYQRAKEHQRTSHGGEVDVDGKPAPDRKRRDKGDTRDSRGRRVQEVGPPSIVRAARRAAIFAVVIFVMFQVLPFGKKLTPQAAAFEAALFFVMLTPFQYLIDRWKYNRWLAHQDQ